MHPYEMEKKYRWTLLRIEPTRDKTLKYNCVFEGEVEEYTPDLPTTDFEAIVICYCQYSPVSTPLEPLPKIQVSQEMQEVEA